ncbi:MAG TPA: DNA-3-methyladenine glycosylase 2 family protein [Hyphomonadaceae bacterium]|nr:DNA-3-methyladenine glycosylase 2 family protein [Hyphomonadaceae bacterium]HPN06971.1 DNA-3-methyladenine glycosylase 2 family protein [Hyphomonadaceae bacterium]
MTGGVSRRLAAAPERVEAVRMAKAKTQAVVALDVTDAKQLAKAVRVLAKECAIIKAAHDFVGVPEWRTRQGDYAGLARIIAYQQLSTKAAGTIWGRVEVLLGKVTPKSVLAADFDALRACGLSRPKISHIRSIAEAVESGTLNLKRVAKASDADAQAELVAVKGIGPWTADVYLMFCLGRWDVFPHADIGLSEAYRMISGERKRHPPGKFLRTGERWRPYRGVAAHMLWSYINAARDAQRGGA